MWISEVGKRGWVILTKDGRLLTNGLIVRALLSSNTHSFVLRAKDMTGEQMGRAFVTAYPSMLKMITKFQPPLVAQVSRAGVPKLLVTYDQLVNRLDPR